MCHVDIAADLNDEDDTGSIWTFLDEARDPDRSSLAPSLPPVTKRQPPCALLSLVQQMARR